VLLKIYPSNPNEKHIQMVVDHLRKGGVIVFPTDTVYALGCDITQFKAVERICKIKGVELEKANFSFVCHDLSHITDYAKHIDNNTFKLMKKALPGPFTFILNASSNVPSRYFGSKTKKKTIGIRIPDNNIARLLVKELGNPLMSTSVHDDDEVIEYTTDPELIHEKYADKVDIVIDAGFGDNEPSTVVDCTENEPVILRQGKGVL
jgi:tRNA threonylcarbamoyl adenosine modification protein (Sua5/YciO/YrdC/YwlC family)